MRGSTHTYIYYKSMYRILRTPMTRQYEDVCMSPMSNTYFKFLGSLRRHIAKDVYFLGGQFFKSEYKF